MKYVSFMKVTVFIQWGCPVLKQLRKVFVYYNFKE